MGTDVASFAKQLKEDGIDAARKEAEKIVADAKKEAGKILENAR
jgi:vacuolar-type H+-ATPase subunit H